MRLETPAYAPVLYKQYNNQNNLWLLSTPPNLSSMEDVNSWVCHTKAFLTVKCPWGTLHTADHSSTIRTIDAALINWHCIALYNSFQHGRTYMFPCFSSCPLLDSMKAHIRLSIISFPHIVTESESNWIAVCTVESSSFTSECLSSLVSGGLVTFLPLGILQWCRTYHH